MGGYIRMDKDLEDDPRVSDLAEALARQLSTLTPEELRRYLPGLACNAVLGGLYRLWRYADTHLGRHNRLKGALHGAARIGDVTALPKELLACFPPEWLKEHADGSMELPDYAAKNSLIDRDIRREKNRERVRRFRERKRAPKEDARPNGNVSKSVTPDALQRYTRVTTGTGTGTGPEPDPPKPGPDRNHTLGSLANGAEAPRSPSEESKPKLGAAELESMAHRLAAKGRDLAAVQSVLGPYGASAEQVVQWLGNAPPEAAEVVP
jgi:hypothetical protein